MDLYEDIVLVGTLDPWMLHIAAPPAFGSAAKLPYEPLAERRVTI
jgi:hypothetical protein